MLTHASRGKASRSHFKGRQPAKFHRKGFMIFDIRKCFLQMIGIVLLLLAVTMLGRAQSDASLSTDVILSQVQFEIGGCPDGYELVGYLYSNPVHYRCRKKGQTITNGNGASELLPLNLVQSYIVDNEGNVSLYRKEVSKPPLTDEYRAEVERRYQKFYPGAKVELYARANQYILLVKYTGKPDLMYRIDVADIDDPKVTSKGVFLRADDLRRKKPFRR